MVQVFAHIPKEVKNKYYGCGTQIPMGISDMKVLDLGSGSGRVPYGLDRN
jgi:hypothetical protein